MWVHYTIPLLLCIFGIFHIESLKCCCKICSWFYKNIINWFPNDVWMCVCVCVWMVLQITLESHPYTNTSLFVCFKMNFYLVFFLILNYLLLFNYSSLHFLPTSLPHPSKPTSISCFHPPPWFCPCKHQFWGGKVYTPDKLLKVEFWVRGYIHVVF